jgi:voltage-gated potassium channel
MIVTKKKSPLSFEILLLSFALLLFIPGIFQGSYSSYLSRYLFTLILLSSLYIVAHKRRDLIIGVLLAIPAFVTNWATLWFLDLKMQLLTHSVCQVVFLIYIVVKISGHLAEAKRVDAETIYAAICLYLLLGVTWAMIYFGIVLVDPNAINLAITTDVIDRESMTLVLQEVMYFSYVTQTTLGYGEITPANVLARAFVIGQSLVGQIFIAVIVARLVGLQIAFGLTDGDEK